jgi:transmembrane sensor
MDKVAFENLQDVLEDEDFLLWAKEEKESLGAKALQDLIDKDPAQLLLVMEALDLLRKMQLQEIEVSEADISAESNRLMEFISKAENHKKPTGITRFLGRWSSVAAMLLFVTIGILVWKQFFSLQKIGTGYSERRDLTLQDGTTVILNSNSSISTASDFGKGHIREVWMNGEVFFKVAHKMNAQKFIVHANKFDVEVTGTQFNVINREHSQSIFLFEGNVNLHQNDNTLVMKPGDFYEYASSALVKKEVRQEAIMAWLDKKIVFENTPLGDVAKTISDYYGVQIHFSHDSVARKTITGLLANDNLADLLQAIGATGDIKIIKENQHSYRITAADGSN